MSENASPSAESATHWWDVPGPVRKKKRVSKTVYWEVCPSCDQRISGWATDTRVQPAYREYEPCGCIVTAPTDGTGTP